MLYSRLVLNIEIFICVLVLFFSLLPLSFIIDMVVPLVNNCYQLNLMMASFQGHQSSKFRIILGRYETCVGSRLLYAQIKTDPLTPVQMTVRDALNSALDEEMSADPKVFLMGEEVIIGKQVKILKLHTCSMLLMFFFHCCRLENIKAHIRSENHVNLKSISHFTENVNLLFSYSPYFPFLFM